MSKYPALIRTFVSAIICSIKMYLIFIKANLLTFGFVLVFENFFGYGIVNLFSQRNPLIF